MAEHNADKPDETDRRENEIDKEIAKLEYYLEGTDELIELSDHEEIQLAVNQTSKITSKLSDLISQLEEFKIDSGVSSRAVRQWKKDVKSKYSNWIQNKKKLSQALSEIEQKSQDETERRRWEIKQQREEAITRERHERERQLWDEKLRVELQVTERRLEMEREARSTTAKLPKLPKLKITPFKGTVSQTDFYRRKVRILVGTGQRQGKRQTF